MKHWASIAQTAFAPRVHAAHKMWVQGERLAFTAFCDHLWCNQYCHPWTMVTIVRDRYRNDAHTHRERETNPRTFLPYRIVGVLLLLTSLGCDSRNEIIHAIGFLVLLFCICNVSTGSFFVRIFSGSLLRFFCHEWCLLLKSRAHTQCACICIWMRVQNHSSTRRWQLLACYYYYWMLLYNKTSPKLKTTWWISANRPKHAPKESIKSGIATGMLNKKRKTFMKTRINKAISRSMWFMLEWMRILSAKEMKMERYVLYNCAKEEITAFLALNFVSFCFWKDATFALASKPLKCALPFLLLLVFLVYFMPRYACMCFHFSTRLK